jgi:hypothetical protein
LHFSKSIACSKFLFKIKEKSLNTCLTGWTNEESPTTQSGKMVRL